MILPCLLEAVSLSAVGEQPDLSSHICGPRCAQYVLKWFGVDADLSELIAEIQGASVDRSSNLGQVKAALVKHGLHVRAARTSPNDIATLAWSGPVIVHYAPTDRSAGHFVVVHPDRSTSTKVCVWDGLSGAALIRASDFSASASGAVLLVATETISSADVLPTRQSFLSSPATVLPGVSALLTIFAILSLRRIRRRSLIALAACLLSSATILQLEVTKC